MKITYDQRERFFNELEILYMTMDSLHARIWTTLPGTIKSIDWRDGSPYASVELGVLGRIIDSGQNVTFTPMPVIQDCPVIFPRGGGYSLTFPLQAGDRCLVLFSARSIDEFMSQGKAAPAHDLRMTDLSDGFVLAGLMTQKNPLKNISTSCTQLRSDDGKNSVSIGSGTISVNASSEINLTVGECSLTINSKGISANKPVTIQSTLTTTGDITATGDVVGRGISLSSHVHGGVKSGGDQTGDPE